MISAVGLTISVERKISEQKKKLRLKKRKKFSLRSRLLNETMIRSPISAENMR